MASNAKIIGDLIAADSSVAIPGDGVILASDLADGSVTTAKLADANVTIGKIATTVPLGTKNIIINGDMRIDQRNAGASVTATTGNEYSIDRFQTVSSVSSKYTIQQSTTSPDDFVNSVIVTSSSAYSVGASEQFLLRQFVEGLNSAHLLWGTANAKTVTLSFWTRSSLTGTFGGAVFNSGGTRSYPFTYTISSADTWEQKTITIPGDTSGTWLTTNGVGLTISFGLGAGSTLSGTAGSWAGAYYGSATGATSVVGTSGATWYVTGVQLEVGDTATSFEHRPYDMELARCQRYYVKWLVPVNTGGGATTWATAVDTIRADAVVFLPTTMRTASLSLTVNSLQFYISTTSGTGSSGTWSLAYATNDKVKVIRYTHGSGVFTAGTAIAFSGNGTSGYLALDGEL